MGTEAGEHPDGLLNDLLDYTVGGVDLNSHLKGAQPGPSEFRIQRNKLRPEFKVGPNQLAVFDPEDEKKLIAISTYHPALKLEIHAVVEHIE